MNGMTRRHFVKKSFGSAAVIAASATLLDKARGASPNNRVILALMGAGGRGMDLIKKFAEIPDVAIKYVCDVDETRGKVGVATLEKITGVAPKLVGDLRQVLDDKEVHGVVVATPEHWHALATVWACQAGKDVYVEKNISLYIWEGRKMMEAAKKYGRIVQAGFQNRSAPYGVSAREYIKKGELGKVQYVKVYEMLAGVVGGYPLRPAPNAEPPPGLNWDRWVGPATARPYNRNLHRGWYGCWDFSGGNASDAVHQLDLARMVLGDPPHPKSVSCDGGRFQFDDGGEMPDVQIVSFSFDKMVMTFHNTGSAPYNSKSPPEVRLGTKWPYWPQNGDRIEIYGSKRMMYLGRHGAGWQVFEGGNKLVAEDKGYHPDKWHLPNFIDCIRTRRQPNGEIEQGHFSACLEHLGNIAYRVGNKKLFFDGKSERFTNCDEANQLLRPAYRKPYILPDEV